MGATKGLPLLSALFFVLFLSLGSWTDAKSLNDTEKIRNAQLDFALDLLRAMNKNSKEAVVVSPASISILLSVLIRGATGKTKRELIQAVAGDVHEDSIYKYFSNLLAGLPVPLEWKDPYAGTGEETHFKTSSTLEIANKIYIDEKQKIKKSFHNFTKQEYGLNTTKAHFSDKEMAAKNINRYVSKKTHGKITDILSSDDINGNALLLNAISFRGIWMYYFLKEKSHSDLFSGSTKVRFMSGTKDVPYYSDESLSYVALPFKVRDGFPPITAYFILPDEKVSLDALLEGLNAEKLNKIIEQAKENERETTLIIPVFNKTAEIDVKDLLSDKLRTALSDRGIYHNISRHFKIGGMKQKAILEWDESVDPSGKHGEHVTLDFWGETPVFNANRPFLTLVADTNRNILFAAVIRM